MRISDWSSDVCSSDLTLSIRTATLCWPRRLRAWLSVSTISKRETLAGTLCRYAAYKEEVKMRGFKHTLVLASLSITTAMFRSEERRVGTEGFSQCRSRWSQYTSKKTQPLLTNR